MVAWLPPRWTDISWRPDVKIFPVPSVGFWSLTKPSTSGRLRKWLRYWKIMSDLGISRHLYLLDDSLWLVITESWSSTWNRYLTFDNLCHGEQLRSCRFQSWDGTLIGVRFSWTCVQLFRWRRDLGLKNWSHCSICCCCLPPIGWRSFRTPSWLVSELGPTERWRIWFSVSAAFHIGGATSTLPSKTAVV